MSNVMNIVASRARTSSNTLLPIRTKNTSYMTLVVIIRYFLCSSTIISSLLVRSLLGTHFEHTLFISDNRMKKHAEVRIINIHDSLKKSFKTQHNSEFTHLIVCGTEVNKIMDHF